jgi:hypothetical protein
MQNSVLALIYHQDAIPTDAYLTAGSQLDRMCSDALVRGPLLVLLPRAHMSALEREAARRGCVVDYFSNIGQVYTYIDLNLSRPTPAVTFPWAEQLNTDVAH